MALDIHPIDAKRPDFVGEVTGIDLRESLPDDEVAAIEAGMDRYAVLVFRGQRITDAQQIAFTRRLGDLEPAYFVPGDDVQAGRLSPELNDISNLDRHNAVLDRSNRQRLYQLGNLLWHSDSSYKSTPAKYSLLSARVVPSWGGATEFADMRAAWDALDARTRALVRDLVCEHSRLHSRRDLGFDFSEAEKAKSVPVRQRLVRRHPTTGRLSLYLSSHGGMIEGWLVPEARALLRELTDHATHPDRVYGHAWAVGDLVMWDNRVTMHRGRRFPAEEPRDMRRTTTTDVGPTLDQAA